MKYSTAFFVESAVLDLVEQSVRRVGGKRFEALWSTWTMHDCITAEEVRRLLLQQRLVESLPQLAAQIYL
jgi:hypothetical protein